MPKAVISITGILLLLLWIAGKGLAFGKDLLVSYYFGVSELTDAYFVASSIPGVLYAGLHATVPLVLLPQYSAKLVAEGIGRASRFASGLLNGYLLAATALSVLAYAFSDGLVRLLAPALNASTSALAGSLTQIFAVTFAFSMMSAVLTTVQLAHKQIFGTQLIPIVNNCIFIIGVYLLAHKLGIYAAAISAAVAWLAQIPLQWFLVRTKFQYTPISGIPRSDVRGLLIVFLPALLSVSLENLHQLISVYFGSGLSQGAISGLSYASRLLSLFTGLFLVITTSITYPNFVRTVAANGRAKLAEKLDAVTKSVLLLSLPMAVIVASYSSEIVTVVFERGAFDADHVLLTSSIVSVLAASIPFIALRDIYLRAIYALQSANIAIVVGLATITVNIATSYSLVGAFETTGLAIAVVLSSLISFGVCYALVLRILDFRIDRQLVYFYIKVLLLTAFSVGVVYVLPMHTSIESPLGRLSLGVALIAGVFVCGYLALGFLRFDARSRTFFRGY